MAQGFHVYDASLALVMALRPVLERLKKQDRALAGGSMSAIGESGSTLRGSVRYVESYGGRRRRWR